MRKKTLLILLAMLMIPLWQATAGTALVVKYTDGTAKTTFLLSQKPEISFLEGTMYIKSGDGDFSFELSEVEDFHFADEGAGIKSTPLDNDGSYVEMLDGNVVKIGGNGSRKVAVYDMNGKVTAAKVSTVGDIATISLGNIPNGIYIIKYGNKSIKISKK